MTDKARPKGRPTASKGNDAKTKKARNGTDEPPAPAPIDWVAQRAQLVADGDMEGAHLLDDLLPRLGDQPRRVRIVGRDAEGERNSTARQLTGADILDALARRANLRAIRGELRAITKLPASNPKETCQRWLALAEFGARFEQRANDGSLVIAWGQGGPVTAHRMYGKQGDPAPELEWAGELRSATESVLELMRGAEDVPVQRMLQGLDRILKGEAVAFVPLVREVDVLVRAAAARSAKKSKTTATGDDAGAQTTSENTAAEQEQALLREHADVPWGRAILEALLREGAPVSTKSLKGTAIAEMEARAAARAETDDSGGKGDKEKHGRRIEESLRVMRTTCNKAAGCPPCADHLGLISTPRRGWNQLTEKGRGIAEAQRRKER